MQSSQSKSSNNAGSSYFPATQFARPAAALLLLASLTSVPAEPGHDNRAPDVPANLEVPDGNKVHFRAFAVGVQIYAWNGSTWVFQAPEAVLFADTGAHGEVAIHYGGPTWESRSGSKVVGMRLAGSTVDASAIPWLLLQSKSTEGPGIFAATTYIQRVNTVGGLAPANAGSSVGQEARVPYTAEYVFYRATN